MFCPDCRTEYRQGIEQCADCGTHLVAVLEPLPPPQPGQDWVPVRTVSSETEARLIEGYLESEGIPCGLVSRVFHAEPVAFGSLGRVQVHVPAQHRDRAHLLLGKLEAQERQTGSVGDISADC